MSDSGALPPQLEAVSEMYRHDQLMSTLLESLMNGIYTCVIILTVYSLVCTQGWRSLTRPLIILILLLYFFAVIHVAEHWALLKHAFIDNGQTQDTVMLYLVSLPLSSTMVTGTLFCASTLIADSILIWRCWVVWNHNWLAVVIPSLTLTAGTVFSILTLIIEANPQTQLSASRVLLDDSAVIYSSFNLATTVIATATIIWRIIKIGRLSRNHYRNVIEIIVESAALYSIVLIIYLPFIVLPNVTDAMPQAVLTQMTGIAPTLIVARVSLGLASPNDSGSEPVSTLNFRASGKQHSQQTVGWPKSTHSFPLFKNRSTTSDEEKTFNLDENMENVDVVRSI